MDKIARKIEEAFQD
jgi:DNA-directed RNA polymerase II subunit RPB1